MAVLIIGVIAGLAIVIGVWVTWPAPWASGNATRQNSGDLRWAHGAVRRRRCPAVGPPADSGCPHGVDVQVMRHAITAGNPGRAAGRYAVLQSPWRQLRGGGARPAPTDHSRSGWGCLGAPSAAADLRTIRRRPCLQTDFGRAPGV